ERENIKTIATQDEALARQRTLNISVAIIAILTGLLGFMLYRNNVARRRANERLDKEVQTATQDLQAANKLLGEVNKELDHFIYKTSHDIRGPLATLKGLCNVALTDVNDQTALTYLHKLDFTASQLDTLLRRLQKINQINNAPLHAHAIDFNEIVDYVELIEKRKGLPPRFKVIREIPRKITYTSDLELVTLIMENLIANAIKFHDTSDRVDPFVKVIVEAEESSIVVKVIDNGIGIGETHPEELFHIFARASERSLSGGIGLYLSRRATQKLGGHIDLHVTSEGFTEVVVTLPLANAENMIPAKTNTESGAATGSSSNVSTLSKEQHPG
ncbi:MAG TPA: HAMP domain-containing sensor histidine kinase, partial [Chryseosolibacter sp.]|nr:HAMP domain-containing sensor histidine kinase [Chryseosolibacter sp.]